MGIIINVDDEEVVKVKADAFNVHMLMIHVGFSMTIFNIKWRFL